MGDLSIRNLGIGALSGLIFLAVVGLKLSVLFLLTPALPLFFLFFQAIARKDMLRALGAGALASLVLGGPTLGVMYLLMIGAPCYWLGMDAKTIRWAPRYNAAQWKPLGVTLCHLSIGCALLLGTSGYHILFDATQATQTLFSDPTLTKQMDAVGPQVAAELKAMMMRLSFLWLGLSGWIWLALFYAHGWWMHRVLFARGLAMRPEFSLQPFMPPTALLVAIAIAALATIIGSPAMQNAGKVGCIVMLFPYFLAGMAQIHVFTRQWSNRIILIFIIYFLMFLFIWPIVAVILYGLTFHLRSLLASTEKMV